MTQWVSRVLERLRTDTRLEWLVVAGVLFLIAVAIAAGWISIDLPRPF